ncbi:hypothetical protein ACHAQJ_002491 [Trichoderma viride]
MPSTLRANVYVAPPIPITRPNGSTSGYWSPISCTLIQGERSAVLVDTPITTAQTAALADWIERVAPGKKLEAIYVTHGHGDHFYGIPTIRKRFPSVKTYATRANIVHMQEQIHPSFLKKTYASQFPGQLDEQPPPDEVAEALPDNGEFFLEGHLLKAIVVGQADTHDSSILWVPDLRLAVCGDVVYGSCHQMLAECTTIAKREAWIQSIERVAALDPLAVVPGHKKEGEIDGVWHLKETIDYIRAFDRTLASGEVKNPKEFTKRMLELYPDRMNPGALIWSTSVAFKTNDKASKI